MIPEDYLNDLNSRLASQAEDVCRHLLTGGKRKGKRWICGGVDGGAGQSMNVELDGKKAGLWRDAATGEGGTLLDLWKENQGLKFPEAVAAAASFMGMPPPDTRESAPKLTISPSSFTYEEPPPEEPEKEKGKEGMPAFRDTPKPSTASDWDKAVASFSSEHAAKLCEWRGFSPDFVKWLHGQELIGVHNGCFAFPVHDTKGNVSRIHYRLEKGWAYHPKGGGDSSPLVIGNPIHATHTLAFESQWDALAILDKLDAHNPDNEGIYSAFITRGATSNTNLSKLAIPHLIAFPQNDPPEKKSKTTGRTPAEEWLHKLQASKHAVTEFLVAETPGDHKDTNDWIREENPGQLEVFRCMVEGAANPDLKGMIRASDVIRKNVTDDENSLIGYENRFLSRGGSWVWVAPSGVGKSTLLTDFCLHASSGSDWHGIKFRKPMKTLVVQAENDEGDIAEQFGGSKRTGNFTREQFENGLSNIVIFHETELTRDGFCKSLERRIIGTKAELVCIDPLLSYAGDDISLQSVASQFLRNWLQPVLKRTGAIAIIIHHTGKPAREGNGQRGWSESDFAYLGLGSSEITNWSRAVSTFTQVGQDSGVYRFLIAKRGKRAGLRDLSTGEPTNCIYLQHSGKGLGWERCEAPEVVEKPRNGGRVSKLSDDNVISPFKGATSSLRKDRLIAQLQTVHDVSQKTVRDAVSRLLLANVIKLESTSPRDGGGTPYEWLTLP